MAFTQIFPGNSQGGDTLRLMIDAYGILKQDLQPKNNPGHVVVGGLLYSWNLVAPTDIQENIQHDWEEYGSWQGRMASLKLDAQKALAAMSAAAGGGLTKASSTTSLALGKVDSPMVYNGSRRLEYSITVPFMRWKGGAFKDVFEPIHQFRKLSCASMGNGDVIGFPAIFSISTFPADFIDIKYAALKDVQTVYQSPFIGGYPQRAECTLTFMDIQPLYQESWKNGQNILTTSTTAGGNSYGKPAGR